MRRLLPMTLLLFTGCAEFLMHRDFLAEMDHNDSSFFSPNNDFPVVTGDEGRYWMSDRERMERTPKSSFDRSEDRYQQALKDELRALEGSQSEVNQILYDQYKAKLGSTSEKIYFLKLRNSERKEYLAMRGFVEETPAENYVHDPGRHPSSTVALGMSKDDVLLSFGKPKRVEIAGNPTFENERWLYSLNGATKYIYFESGRVGGWE